MQEGMWGSKKASRRSSSERQSPREKGRKQGKRRERGEKGGREAEEACTRMGPDARIDIVCGRGVRRSETRSGARYCGPDIGGPEGVGEARRRQVRESAAGADEASEGSGARSELRSTRLGQSRCGPEIGCDPRLGWNARDCQLLGPPSTPAHRYLCLNALDAT